MEFPVLLWVAGNNYKGVVGDRQKKRASEDARNTAWRMKMKHALTRKHMLRLTLSKSDAKLFIVE